MEKRCLIQMELKKAGVAIFLSDKIDSKTKAMIRDKKPTT